MVAIWRLIIASALLATVATIVGCGSGVPSYKDRLDDVDPLTFPLDEPTMPSRRK
jgi:hypothetical protein